MEKVRGGGGGGETQSILDRSLTWLNLGAYLRCDVRCLLDIIVSADRIRCFLSTDYYVGGPCPTLVLFFFFWGWERGLVLFVVICLVKGLAKVRLLIFERRICFFP